MVQRRREEEVFRAGGEGGGGEDFGVEAAEGVQYGFGGELDQVVSITLF